MGERISTLLFSVVIPLYNKADTVIRTLQSVEQQTFRDFEVVIVDDGSSDNGRELASGFNSSFKKRIHRQENAGVSVARNTGAELAFGQYLAFLDADDEWEPGYLEEINRMICANKSCEVFGANYRGVGVSEIRELRSFSNKFKLVDFIKEWGYYSPIHTSSTVIQKKAFCEVGGFVVGHKYYEDAELLFKLALRGRFCVSPRVLAKYHTDANVRATGKVVPYSEYAHWQYVESVLAKGCSPLVKIAYWDFMRRFVENFIHNRLKDSIDLSENFPNMALSLGKKQSLLLHRKNILFWCIALFYKIRFVIIARLKVRTRRKR